MKKKLLILQNKILHYRKPLFNELAKSYKVTVLHSGASTLAEEDSYGEMIVNCKKIGPFYIQSNVMREVMSNNYDIIISMFDLRWIKNIFAMYMHNKDASFIWWGPWLTSNYIANKTRLFLLGKPYPCIFYSEKAKQEFKQYGVSSDKLFVANNTIDVGRRVKSYESVKKDKIIFVGTLDKRKKLDIVIQAFSNIVNKLKPEIKLLIIGSGDEEKMLKSQVEQLKLQDRVFFKGAITDAAILKNYYQESIVSVSYGQAGLSVLQSLGYGVPIITNINAISGGEITNVIDGTNGYLCEESLSSLEECLYKICSNKQLAKHLGRNAYDYYTEFATIEKTADGFKQAIEYGGSNRE